MTKLKKSYLYKYYQQIAKGKINVSRWIYKIFTMLVKGVESGRYYYDAEKADKCIKFVETFIHHSKGRNDMLVLELWQKAIICAIFGIVNEDGKRQFREVLLIVARKNGKSLFASAIIACLTFIDKEYGAEIYCLAPKLEQANIVFDNFYQTISNEPELLELCKKRRTDIYLETSNTVVKPLAFSDKKSDGLNPHGTVCDEIAAWSGQNGLRMYEVMKSALGSRTQPLILSISTAGYVNDSIYDELMIRATAFLNGSSEETQLLPFLYMIDDIERWDCIDELEKSNPNLGVSVSKAYLLEEIRIAKGSLSKRAEFITKYCNLKQNSSQAWLTYELVDGAGKKEYTLNDFKGCYGVGGIDLSQTTDLTCASIVIEKDDQEYAFSQFFMPKNKLKELIEIDKVPYDIYVKQGYLILSGENYVDYKDVKAWFDMLRHEYQIYACRVGYDRYSAQYLVDEMNNKGYRMDDVIQGWNLSPIIREFEGKLKDGSFHVGKNNLLKSHLLNVALKYESDNQKFKPVKMKASDHIDGFVSIIDALTVKSKYYNEIKFIIQNREG
ncbi:MAG: terminase large subunit [Oscillospiraceae bacterium]|nr:terminase large subunit [Oscillospiraceae bacterium]